VLHRFATELRRAYRAPEWLGFAKCCTYSPSRGDWLCLPRCAARHWSGFRVRRIRERSICRWRRIRSRIAKRDALAKSRDRHAVFGGTKLFQINLKARLQKLCSTLSGSPNQTEDARQGDYTQYEQQARGLIHVSRLGTLARLCSSVSHSYAASRPLTLRGVRYHFPQRCNRRASAFKR
jgi:hypothetical protein